MGYSISHFALTIKSFYYHNEVRTTLLSILSMSEDQPQIVIEPNKSPFYLKIAAVLCLILLAGAGYWIFAHRKPEPSQAPPSSQVSKVSLPCPAGSAFCQTTKPVVKNDQILGVGAEVEEETPVYAVFDGKVAKRSVNNGYYQLTLTNEQKKLKAVYMIKLDPQKDFEKLISIPSEVKEKGILVNVPAQDISYFGKYNLVFALLDENNQRVPPNNMEFTQ